jgi:hypothetical protein
MKSSQRLFASWMSSTSSCAIIAQSCILKKVQRRRRASAGAFVSGDTPFGLPTNFARMTIKTLNHFATRLPSTYRSWTSVWLFIRTIRHPKECAHLIDSWKVLLPEAYGERGAIPALVLGPSIVAPPESVCTQTYLSRRAATIEEILAPKPEARPRIYAYSIDDKAHKGLLKVGQTTRDVKQRVAEQLKTAASRTTRSNWTSPPSATTAPSSPITRCARRSSRRRLREHRTGMDALHGQGREDRAHRAAHGQRFTGTHHQTFPMRREQAEAVKRRTPTSTRSGRRTCTPSRASCGTRRCASARPSPPISSPRSSAPSACSW